MSRPTARPEQRAATMADLLVATSAPFMGPNDHVLIVGDQTGAVAQNLTDRGLTATEWNLVAVGDKRANPSPPSHLYNQALIRLPKGRRILEYVFQSVASRLHTGGRVWIVGANDEGVRSTGKSMKRLFGEVSTVATKKHCRVWVGKQDSRPGVEPPCWHTGEIALPSGIREWINGVNAFAKGTVDPGTGFLLSHLPQKNPFPDQPGKLLDFGCGSGVITAELIQRGWNIEPFMLDADAISLSVASKNIPNSTAWISDGWIGVPNQQRFDAIVSNPPFHQGVLRDLGVVNRLIAKAPKHLTPKGRMWMVTQRQVHVGDNLGKAFKRVEIVKQNSQYRIWRAEGI